MTDPSGGMWNAFYHHPGDSRLWVWRRQRFGAGWTINFAHPSASPVLTGTLCGTVYGLLVVIACLRLSYVQTYPEIALWWALASIAALVVFHLNGVGIRLDRETLGWLGYGALALAIGFACQGVLNGGFIALVGADRLTWRHHLYLGPMAALCQTFGKVVGITVASRVLRTNTAHHGVKIGLAVGLGFALVEITLIVIQMIVQQQPLDSYLGVWERASASMFHIYSSALAAIALMAKRYHWFVWILAVHAGLDWLAGTYKTVFPDLSLVGLETIVCGLAILMWGSYRWARRRVT